MCIPPILSVNDTNADIAVFPAPNNFALSNVEDVGSSSVHLLGCNIVGFSTYVQTGMSAAALLAGPVLTGLISNSYTGSRLMLVTF